MRLLGGLMALGYTIAAILKRSSHIFSDERVCVKIDWLEQLNRHYVQVKHKFCLFFHLSIFLYLPCYWVLSIVIRQKIILFLIFCCFKFAWLICYVLWGSLMLTLIRMSFCSFFPPIFKTGARKRSSSCQVHGRATGIGGFIHSSYLYRTNTTWKACEWGYGTSKFEVLCDLLSCNLLLIYISAGSTRRSEDKAKHRWGPGVKPQRSTFSIICREGDN